MCLTCAMMADPRSRRPATTWTPGAWPEEKCPKRVQPVVATTAARLLPHPDIADAALPKVLFALSDAARLDIVRKLAARGPLTVAECQPEDRAMPKSTFSHHLRTLREAGLVRNEPSGRRRTITLRIDQIEQRFPGLLGAILN
jgi:DNA-binding transcriptional ArsR family regulator